MESRLRVGTDGAAPIFSIFHRNTSEQIIEVSTYFKDSAVLASLAGPDGNGVKNFTEQSDLLRGRQAISLVRICRTDLHGTPGLPPHQAELAAHMDPDRCHLDRAATSAFPLQNRLTGRHDSQPGWRTHRPGCNTTGAEKLHIRATRTAQKEAALP